MASRTESPTSESSGVFFYTNLQNTKTTTTITFAPVAPLMTLDLEVLSYEATVAYRIINDLKHIQSFNRARPNSDVISYSPLFASTTSRTTSSSSSSTSAPSTAYKTSKSQSTVTTLSTLDAATKEGVRFSSGAVAGLVVGLIVAVAALTFLLTIWGMQYRRHKKSQIPDSTGFSKPDGTAITAAQGNQEEPSTMVESDPRRE